MVLSPERESNLPKENLSKTPEEKGFEIEKSRIHGVKVLLDIVKMGIKENYITSAESVEWLCEVIKKARSEGIDLSSIENLDEEVKKLQQEAPLTSIKACLEKTKEFIDNDEKNVPRSWYFETIKEFNKYKEIIAPEEAEKIQKELDEIKSKLNLK